MNFKILELSILWIAELDDGNLLGFRSFAYVKRGCHKKRSRMRCNSYSKLKQISKSGFYLFQWNGKDFGTESKDLV